MGHLFQTNSQKYAFIHIPKCGGGFFKTVFGLLDDAQKYLSPLAPLTTVLKSHQPKGEEEKPDVAGHWTYQELLETLGISPDEYKFIAIIRNPWDKMVSEYHYIKQISPRIHGNHEAHAKANSGKLSFKDFVMGLVEKDFSGANANGDWVPLWDYLVDDKGDIAVDHVFKVETLNADIDNFLLENGVDFTTDAKKVTTEFDLAFGALAQSAEEKVNTSEHAHYREYYDEELIEIVREAEQDIVSFYNYEF